MTKLTFLFIEIGIYCILMLRYQNNNHLFYISVISLFICPFIDVGIGGDFCMRASIPALLVMMLLSIDTLRKAGQKRDKITIILLTMTLLVGAVTPLHEIKRTIVNTEICYKTNNAVRAGRVKEKTILKGANFSGSADGDFFYEYIARH